jgi:hypothetical protein
LRLGILTIRPPNRLLWLVESELVLEVDTFSWLSDAWFI